jgi:hypothetical protein
MVRTYSIEQLAEEFELIESIYRIRPEFGHAFLEARR